LPEVDPELIYALSTEIMKAAVGLPDCRMR